MLQHNALCKVNTQQKSGVINQYLFIPILASLHPIPTVQVLYTHSQYEFKIKLNMEIWKFEGKWRRYNCFG